MLPDTPRLPARSTAPLPEPVGPAERHLDSVLAHAAGILMIGSHNTLEERGAAQDTAFAAIADFVAHRRAEGDTPELALVRLKRVFAPHAHQHAVLVTNEDLAAFAMRAFLTGYFGRRGEG